MIINNAHLIFFHPTELRRDLSEVSLLIGFYSSEDADLSEAFLLGGDYSRIFTDETSRSRQAPSTTSPNLWGNLQRPLWGNLQRPQGRVPRKSV